MSKIVRIGVLSDTHIHNLKDSPSSLMDSLKAFDLVIHLGDFVSPELVEYFKGFNNFGLAEALVLHARNEKFASFHAHPEGRHHFEPRVQCASRAPALHFHSIEKPRILHCGANSS